MFTKTREVLAVGFCILCAAGCISASNQGAQSEVTSVKASIEPPPAPVTESSTVPEPLPSPSKLGYGTVTSTVKKGVTTQAELLDLFGAPNIATTDADGTETWVYERTATETNVARSQTFEAKGRRNVDSLAVFFLVVGAGQSSEKGEVKGESSQQSSVSSSIKTLTVIVKFDKDKKVKDFSARAAQF
ncbi:MAG TPA: hypothetical protein PK967_20125 [Candidatus Hydrogenedentes bacterium]|nr:hypothetical protein [Candidatus Hydrogenedentota bacterium]